MYIPILRNISFDELCHEDVWYTVVLKEYEHIVSLTRLCVREVLSMNADEGGLLWTSIAGVEAAPGNKAVLPIGRFPLCCHFSARK